MNRSRFDFREPDSLEDALAILADPERRAVPVAGGTDLLRGLRRGVRTPPMVLSLGRVEELRSIDAGPDGGLSVGALVTMAELAASDEVRQIAPALAEAAAQVGSPQVRNRATVGGNLCNASPCADSAPPAVVFDAVAVLRSAGATRRVPVEDFMTGPGATVLRPGELLVAIELPAAAPHTGSAFFAGMKRKAMEITTVSAAARLRLEAPGGAVAAVRIALGAVAPTPIRAPSGESLLAGQAPTAARLAKAAAAAASDAIPIDDVRAGIEYRKHLTAVLARRALERALARAQGGER